MIVKPCPECGRKDAGCGCYPYYESQCRDCGAIVLGLGAIAATAVEGCHQCTPGVPLEL